MNIRYPNRTAQAGVFHAGTPATVTLSDAALPGHLVLTGRLGADDYVGVSVQSQNDAEAWMVALARSDGADTLEVYNVETESDPPLGDGTDVDVTVCVTEAMLQRAFWRLDPLSRGAGYGELTVWRPDDPAPPAFSVCVAAVAPLSVDLDFYDGDASWSAQSSGTAWNADVWWWEHTGAATPLVLEPAGTWAADYRPVRAWCELHLAPDFYYDAGNPPRIVIADSEAAVFTGPGVALIDTVTPRWVRLWCDLTLTGDIAQLRVENVSGSAFRVRNIAFEPGSE